MASAPPASPLLVWRRTSVDGRTALYGEAGSVDGDPVLFLHGWALGQHTYKRALKRLAAGGWHVFAPALPGFGGTADLPRARFSFPGYGDWAERFLSTVGVVRPATVIGHSFGGGVAIQLAHDHPDRVERLILVNSVGSAMLGRPLWDWGRSFPREGLSVRGVTRVVPVVVEDALPNLLRNPLALLRTATLVRGADLGAELDELRRRRLPVAVLWGDKDRIIPKAAFDELCRALGSEGQVVAGAHGWLLADPDAFGEIVTNVLAVKNLAASKLVAEPVAGDRRP